MRSPEQEPTLEIEPTQAPPRIYVASLTDYNNGHLHGEWLRADQPIEDLAEGVQAMLDRSPEPFPEETAIHDYEGFVGWTPGEYDWLDVVSRVASGLVEHGPAFGHWADYAGTEDESLDAFEEAYLGGHDSALAYAEYLAEEIGLNIAVTPANWEHYVHFDAEALARDLEIELHVCESERGIYVFDPRVL